jgi:Ca-activated chloride channel family protein
MAAEDFNDEKKDAGELGSGHTVTALYEIIPPGVKSGFASNIDSLKYQKSGIAVHSLTDEMLTIKFRYKTPGDNASKLITKVVMDESKTLEMTSDNFRFSAAVASFAMMLRDSEYKQQTSNKLILSLARSSKGADVNGYRQEFIGLVEAVETLAKKD